MPKTLARLGAAAIAVGTTGVLAVGPVDAAGIGGPTRIQLSGANEFNTTGAPINPHGDADRGRITMWLDQKHGRVCWKVNSITLTAGETLPHAAHIHEAPAGLGGPIRVDLFGTATTPAAPAKYPTRKHCVSAPTDRILDMRQNPAKYYVNLHNAQHPGGVMRGQLG